MRSAFTMWGAGEAAAAGGDAAALPIPITEIAQIAATAIEQLQDPIRRYEVLTTRAAQARAAGREAEAQIYDAKARAWAYRIDEERGLRQSRAEWSGLGKAVLGAGGLLLLAATVLLFASAFRRRRR